jgi:Na+-driven multidrug efflux pump
MNGQTILLISDMRQVYLAEILTKKGMSVRCLDIRGYIVDTIFAGIHFSFTGYFAACGKSYIGFLHNIIAIVLVRVPGSYLASRLFAGTLLPMGLAAPAGSLLSVMICVAAYRWMKRRGTLYTAA